MQNYQTFKRSNSRILSVFERLEDRRLMSAVAFATPTVTPHAAPAAQLSVVSTAGTGLSGEYYSDSNFQTAYLLRTDSTVKLTPNAKKDPSALQAQSIRWTGKIAPSYTEPYSFSVIANGGVQVWVDGQLLISQSQATGGNYLSQKISLTAGQQYSIKIEYTRHSAAGAKVQLMWASHHQKLSVVPQKALFPDSTASLTAVSAGLIGQYFIGKDFSTPVMQRVDSTINFSFGAASPILGAAPGSSFSIRWTGQITPQYSETYTFSTLSDDGVRLYVDDQLLINDFDVHTAKTDSAQITLVAGQAYDIRMDYYENHGVATAKLMWSSPSQPQEIVPASAFTSTPPATAGTLSATVNGDDSVHLNWTGSSSATGYNVEESTDGGATYQIVKTTDASATQCDLIGLSPNSSYMFRVVPMGSQDTSLVSNPISTKTATLSPGGVGASPVSPTAMNISWQDVPGENGFNVYQALASAPNDFVQIAKLPAGTTSYTASGLSPGTSYIYAVRSVDSLGSLSDPSAPVSATSLPDAPGSIDSNPAGANSVLLNWAEVPGETGFAIERSLSGTDQWQQIATTLQGVTTYTDTTVLPGTAYDYRVRSLDAGGASDPSSVLSLVTALNAPTGLVTSLTTSLGTLLNWNDVTGENGFEILESTNGGQTFSQIGITAPGVTTFSVSGLNSGSNYQFAIEAMNSTGTPSSPSTLASILTLPSTPGALTTSGLTATAGHLAWTDVPGETGFVIQRSADGITGWSSIATLPAGTLNYSDTSLTPGTTYFYRVSALNASGASAPTPVVSALTIPAVPVASLTGLSVAQSQVSWPVASGVGQYTVQRSNDGLTNWTTVASQSGSSLQAVVPNLTPSTIYYYRVIANNASGQSAPSAVVSQMSAPSSSYAMDSAIYGATAGANIFSLDMTQGTSTLVGQLLPGAYCVNRCPASGLVYYFTGNNSTPTAHSWDPTTGNNVTTAQDSFGGTPNRTAWDPSSTVYVTDTAGDLYHIIVSPHSVTKIGNLTTLAGTALAQGPGNMAFSPQGTLYLLNSGQLYTVNTTTAVVTPVGSIGFAATNFVFGQEGLIYATTPNGQQVSVNPNTLVSSLITSTTVPVFSSLTAMPEFVNVGVTATASANAFTAGVAASYAINVTNGGPNSADSISVSVTLGQGITFSSIAGTGWTAVAGGVGATGQVVVLTYSGVVIANGYAPTATLNVTVGSSAHASAVTTFSVSDDQFNTAVTNTFTTVATAVI